MAQRSTRNKIRFQCESAFADLRAAQIHLVQMAALAGESSPYINETLPELIAAVEMVIETLDKFSEGL